MNKSEMRDVSWASVTRNLWKEEGISFFKKGMLARVLSNAPGSFLMIVVYEWVKRASKK